MWVSLRRKSVLRGVNSEARPQINPPPQDGRVWFPWPMARVSKAAFITSSSVHDLDRGWGRLSEDGMWFSWDSRYDPRKEKPKHPLIDLS